MIQKNERTEQIRREALDALGLSETNRRLAEQYLRVEYPKDPALLRETQKQDFYELKESARKKSMEYVEYCAAGRYTEELMRYVQYTAAVGGSTLSYILPGIRLYSALEWLTPAQQAAVVAEICAWNKERLKKDSLLRVFQIGEKSPKNIRRAAGLCFRRGYNVQILLYGIYLCLVKPDMGVSGAGIKTAEDTGKVAGHLLKTLTGCLPALIFGGNPVPEEMEALKRYVECARPEEEFPEQFHNLFRGRKFSEYLLTLLSGAAFLSMDHSKSFLVLLRVLTAMDMDTVLDACQGISEEAWFDRHLEQLEHLLPVPAEKYVQWCASRRAGKALARISLRCPKAVQKASAALSTEAYQYLMAQLKKENTSLYQEVNLAFSGVFRIRQAGELVSHYPQGRAEAKRYLLGSAGPEEIRPFIKVWRAVDKWIRLDYEGKRSRQLEELKKDSHKQMYRRAVVLEGLCLNVTYFCNFHVSGRREETWKGMQAEELREILGIFEQEKIPVRYQTDLLEAICSDGPYAPAGRVMAMEACVQVLTEKKKEWSPWYVSGVKDGSVFLRSLCIRVLGNFADEYKETLLSCSMDGSARVRKVLAEVCTSHREWEPEILSMLKSPRSQERETAVQVLESWGADHYRAELKQALALEKSRKIQGMLQKNPEFEGAVESVQDPAELEAMLLKGGRRRKVSWACEDMPAVYNKDKTAASGDRIAALLLCYEERREPGVSKEASLLAGELEEEGLASYMRCLLERWIRQDADAKKKWVLWAASVHGGEEVLPLFRDLIQELPKKNRKLMAADAVKALALNESCGALSFVEETARKCRYSQIREAALEAFVQAAQRQGMTSEELEDRIVPDLGFDRRMERVFDYGKRSFKAVLTPASVLEVQDENGRLLKNIPAPGRKDDQKQAAEACAAFKQLKKQLKTVVADQKLRMERIFLSGRRWEAGAWKELFLEKPVMYPFAVGLIWGVCQEEQLTETFRCLEDGTFSTVNGEEYELPEDIRIGLVHPLELSEEQRLAWKEHLEDYEISQPVDQLDRPVFRLSEEEREKTELDRFGGIVLKGLPLSGRLQDAGWRRGPVGDGGVYDTFYRVDGSAGAELMISGCHVAGIYDEETVLYGVRFYRTDRRKRGRNAYDLLKERDLCRLGEVSPGYISEILLQITRAMGTVLDRRPYPACRDEKE